MDSDKQIVPVNKKEKITPEVVEFYVGDTKTPESMTGKKVKMLRFLMHLPMVIRSFIELIGEDPNRQGLKATPFRMIRAGMELFRGYLEDPKDVFTYFDSDGYNQMVVLKNLEFFSLCEHHMLPFYGQAHIAYVPKDKVIGISKLARLLDIYSRRLQIQERIGEQITRDLMHHLDAQGAACVIEGVHLCMRMRGVQKQNSVMTTSSVKGVFMDEGPLRNELMLALNLRSL